MFLTRRCIMICAMIGLLLTAARAPLASAANTNFTFERPSANRNQTNEVEMSFTRNGSTERVRATIPQQASGGDKRDAIKAALRANSFDVADVGLTGMRIEGLPEGTEVKFDPGNTGEPKDTQTATNAPQGMFGFGNGIFNPLDDLGNPAQFTGGIITDAGELMAHVSAQEVLFPSGPLIAQALFQRLMPQAPNFGATLNLLGGTITATFDPAFATGEAGVIFGTTSPSTGLFSSMAATPEPTALAAVAVASVLLIGRPRRGVFVPAVE